MIRAATRPGPLQSKPTRLSRGILLLVVAALTSLVAWPAFAHAVEVWSTTEEFSFGFAVPAVSMLLVWWRRDTLRHAVGPGAAWGLPVVLVALGLYLLAYRVGINAVGGIAVIPLLWGIVIY